MNGIQILLITGGGTGSRLFFCSPAQFSRGYFAAACDWSVRRSFLYFFPMLPTGLRISWEWAEAPTLSFT